MVFVTRIRPESALLTDVARLRDVHHPAVCLYDPSADRDWGGGAAHSVHLGFYASTVLAEFAVLRGQMRRFTVAHLMVRMGFGAPDINHYATYVDHSLYRRVICETRTSFIAEHFAPKLLLFRGAGWVALWDLYLQQRVPASSSSSEPGWARGLPAEVAADALVRELEHTPVSQLLPSDPDCRPTDFVCVDGNLSPTVLGALHRQMAAGTATAGYDASPLMERLPELQSDFLRDVRSHLRGGVLAPAVLGLRTYVRAWPVCLRRIAREHVRA